MGGLGIVAGVGLTLFGIRFLRKGLDRLLGGTLVRWVSRMTRHRWDAFGAGIAMGVVAPSSTGLALLGAQLLGPGNGGVDASRMLAVLLGANVGLTVTVHLLSLPAGDFAAVLIAGGVIGYQYCRRELWRGLGQCALALGFVFLAMKMISEGAAAAGAARELRELFRVLQGNPIGLIAGVTLLAVALQSSTAAIALGLGLALSGLIAPTSLISWILGTNLGLGVTSLLAGWGQIASRRLGFENVLAKLAGVVAVMPAAPAIHAGFAAASLSLPLQAALLHTGFNLVVGLAGVSLLQPLHRLSGWLIPTRGNGALLAPPTFLDRTALETPSLALARATRETLRMADHARVMIENFWRAFVERDSDLARRVQQEDDGLDRMNLELKDYLSRIGENRSHEDTHWQFTLLAFANDLEAVGDLVDKHLCDALLKQQAEATKLPAVDRIVLADVYHRVVGMLELATEMLTARNPATAKTILAEKQRFNDWCRQLQREHYERLAGGSRDALAASAYFLDSLNALRRINSHVSTIGYALERAHESEVPALRSSPPSP